MKKITTWSPDTCSCVLNYEWDDSVPPEERIHTPIEPTKLCEHHCQYQGDHQSHYISVLAENQKKNQAIGAADDKLVGDILASLPIDLQNTLPVLEMLGIRTRRTGHFTFSYDEKRSLRLTCVHSLKQDQLTTIQKHLIDNGHDDVIVS